ncbi:MAG: GGDEF domain-containing protein [Sulfurimonas sp.]|nr:GGDEF domain-containing protein [Sulfurimonas sp.]
MNEIQEITTWLIAEQDRIVTNWLHNDAVAEYLTLHRINRDKFAIKFAHPILLYNLEVVSMHKKAGNCPIMSQFINYMIEKKINSHEIFIICAKLRATILEHLSHNYPHQFDTAEVIMKIADVFDNNLTGVLKHFDTKALETSLQKQENLDTTLYSQKLQVILDVQKNILFKMHGNQLFLANQAFYHAMGVQDAKELEKHFLHPLDFIETSTVFEELLKRKEYDKWLMKIISEHNGECEIKFFNYLLDKRSMMKMHVQQVGEANNFVFTLEDSFLEEDERKISNVLSSVDPLTNLGNLTKFKEMLEKQIDIHAHDELSILMIDIDGFKIFNDTHHKKSGEKLIKNISDILKDSYPDSVARLDFERFAVICKEKNVNNTQDIIDKINKLLKEYNSQGKIKPLAAIVIHRKDDTVELMLARGDVLLNQVRLDSLDTIIDDTVIIKKEAIRLEQEKEFLLRMKRNKEEKKTIPVTNYYLEIGIKSDATILSVMADKLSISIRKIALNSLHKNDAIYIKMPQKPDYKALVYKVDKLEEYVVLHSFKAVELSPLDRNHVHVKLPQPMGVSLYFNKKKIDAKLQSVSINTFEIVIQDIFALEVESQVSVTATLNEKEASYSGKVLKIIPLVDRFIIVVHLDANALTEEILSRYVSNRQLEIIKDLQKNIL